MMGGKTNTPATQPSATPSASPSPSIEANTIAITYTSAGMSPGEIHVKKGETVTLVVDVKDTISGCMHMMLIP
jgi:plastocyanin domain-containing protein